MFGRKHLIVEVTGLTCEHCVQHTTNALQALAGVKKVAVDLAPAGTSQVKVTYQGDLTDDAVSQAIAQAGYQVVAIRR